MLKPEFVETETTTALTEALKNKGHVTIPTAVVLAAISAASAFGIAWLNASHTPSAQLAESCKKAEEGVTQLQADARRRDEHAQKFEQDVTTTLSLLLIRTDKLR
jgi:hypothetical protein